jgi:NADPH2:quinone reductase
VTGLDVNVLAQKGSLYLTRPTLHAYTSLRSELDAAAAELFDMVRTGRIRIGVNQEYALADAVSAHRDLEARRTTGSTLLRP